ncbi:MAG: hypothetical protein HQ559_07735 [Lentisphaerae bacterium]|nr:hypothetical protein [Lentisphaerota bacterium]
MKRLLAAGWMVAASCFVIPVVQACSVPVHRFALENWHSDPYRLYVLYDAGSAPEPNRVLEFLRPFERDLFCVDLRLVDVSSAEEEKVPLPLRNAVSNTPLPAMALLYPETQDPFPIPETGAAKREADEPVWTGPASLENARRLMESPLRTRVAGLLAKGATGVWLLLEGADEEENRRAAETIEATVKKIGEWYRPPEILPYDRRYMRYDIPLTFSFPLLRVDPADPAEHILLRLLLGTAPDPSGRREPVAFAMFGRGRMLAALSGAEINEDGVEGVCGFLCGSCSCTIKDLNPGTDILVSFDWTAALEKAGAEEDPQPPEPPGSLASLMGSAPAGAPPTNRPPPATPPPGGHGNRRLLFGVLAAVGGMVLIVTAVSILASRKGSGPR